MVGQGKDPESYSGLQTCLRRRCHLRFHISPSIIPFFPFLHYWQEWSEILRYGWLHPPTHLLPRDAVRPSISLPSRVACLCHVFLIFHVSFVGPLTVDLSPNCSYTDAAPLTRFFPHLFPRRLGLRRLAQLHSALQRHQAATHKASLLCEASLLVGLHNPGLLGSPCPTPAPPRPPPPFYPDSAKTRRSVAPVRQYYFTVAS